MEKQNKPFSEIHVSLGDFQILLDNVAEMRKLQIETRIRGYAPDVVKLLDQEERVDKILAKIKNPRPQPITIFEAFVKQAVEKKIQQFEQMLNDLPENRPLYKDTGLWQVRSDDMEDIIYWQNSSETFFEFIEKVARESEAENADQ